MPKARVVRHRHDGSERSLEDLDLDNFDLDGDTVLGSADDDPVFDRSNTMAAKKAAPKEKEVEKDTKVEGKAKEKEAKPENNNVKLADVAKEFDMTGRAVRIHLRAKGYERTEGRWEWDPKSADLAKLRKELAAKGEEAEEKGKEDKKADKKAPAKKASKEVDED